MKVRLFTKFVIFLPIMILFLSGCGMLFNKYEWLASESAPKGYPMEIITGDFHDAKGGALYIPSGKQMHDGWGTEVSHHIVGEDKKRLPDRFDVTYFSYTENLFYSGEFNLPAERIKQLFSKGYYSPKIDKKITYDMIVVGVAPGGFITVWLKGINKTTEVFFGFADKVQIPWKSVIDTDDYSREGFIQFVLEEEIGQEGIASLKKNGIPYGQWEKYRERYNWIPQLTGVSQPKVINSFRFFNGERDYFSEAYDNDWENEPKAVPLSMHFVWKHHSNKVFSVKVQFDEKEIINAFEQLSEKSDQPMQLTVDIKEEEKMLFYNFYLRTGDESINLKSTTFDHYLAAMSGDRLEKFLKEN